MTNSGLGYLTSTARTTKNYVTRLGQINIRNETGESRKELQMTQLEYEMYEEAQVVIETHTGSNKQLLSKVTGIGFIEDAALELIAETK